jgi:L-galactose dehydrogenase
MDRRVIAGTNVAVSALGFGAAPLGDEYGRVDEAAAFELVRTALERGVNYFDTSPYYGRGLSERRLGNALRGVRDQAIISTKAGRYDRDYPDGFDFSRSRIEASIDESLGRLQTDYIDIVYLHDIEFAERNQVFDEALPALRDARDRGKVRLIGVAAFPLDVLADVVRSSDAEVALSYCHADFLDQGAVDDLVPLANEHGCSIVTASPFHMGLLSSMGPPDWHPAGPERRAAAAAIKVRCRELGVSVAAAAVSFAAGLHGPVSLLSGVSSREELLANLDAIDNPVDSSILAELAAIAPRFGGGRWPSGIR